MKLAAQRPALLDVNVLIALLDPDHMHHVHATTWLNDNVRTGWASCAITQNGCVRILSQPGYPNPVPVNQAAQRLRAATQAGSHYFGGQSVSLLDGELFDLGGLRGHRQLTDAYLLGLAVTHHLRLATFDAGLPVQAVRGATTDHLALLWATDERPHAPGSSCP